MRDEFPRNPLEWRCLYSLREEILMKNRLITMLTDKLEERNAKLKARKRIVEDLKATVSQLAKEKESLIKVLVESDQEISELKQAQDATMSRAFSCALTCQYEYVPVTSMPDNQHNITSEDIKNQNICFSIEDFKAKHTRPNELKWIQNFEKAKSLFDRYGKRAFLNTYNTVHDEWSVTDWVSKQKERWDALHSSQQALLMMIGSIGLKESINR